MVTQQKLVRIHLPEELHQALISYQEQQEFTEISEAVVAILAQFFQKGNAVERYATLEQLEALERRVVYLSEQVTQLSQVIASSATSEAARVTSPVGLDNTQLANSLPSTSVTFGSISFEEAEDEPDEILYDFLEPERPPSSKSDR